MFWICKDVGPCILHARNACTILGRGSLYIEFQSSTRSASKLPKAQLVMVKDAVIVTAKYIQSVYRVMFFAFYHAAS